MFFQSKSCVPQGVQDFLVYTVRRYGFSSKVFLKRSDL